MMFRIGFILILVFMAVTDLYSDEIEKEKIKNPVPAAPVAAATLDETEKKAMLQTETVKQEPGRPILLSVPGTLPSMRFGAYMYRKTLDRFLEKETELAEICAGMGINEVYLSFSSKRFTAGDRDYAKRLQTVIAAFHGRKIQVQALAMDEPNLIFDHEKAGINAKNVVKFNEDSPKNSRFDGITADLEAHMLKEKSIHLWGKHPYYWSQESYGIDGPNDRLIKETLKALATIHAQAGKLPLSQAVSVNYFRHFRLGELSVGSPSDYEKAGCSFLLLMVYSNRATKVVDRSMPFLQDAKTPASVMVTIKTSLGTSGDEGPTTSFSGLNRSEFLIKLGTIIDTCGKEPSFRGIAFFEFDGLEKIMKTLPENRD